MRIMVYFMGCILLTGCMSLGSFRSQNGERQIDEDEYRAIVEDRTIGATVQSMHWKCCYDLCRRTDPKEVFKEAHTSYIVCTCRNGKRFRVTRLK